MTNRVFLLKISTILCIIFIFCIKKVSAQDSIQFCACKTVGTPIDSILNRSDSTFASSVSDSVSVYVTFFNQSNDTLYILNSYLQPILLGSQYLHRIDYVNKKYKISFLPLVPFLFTQYSDLIQYNNAVVGRNQIVYDFYKIIPHSYYTIRFYFNDLFFENGKLSGSVQDFDVKSLNKFDRNVKFKSADLKKLSHSAKYYFEFAAYKSVALLCNRSAYYLREYQFDKQSKEFSSIEVIFTPPYSILSKYYNN